MEHKSIIIILSVVCFNADPSNEGDLEDLFHEMQLMSQLAPHPNVMRLIGIIAQGTYAPWQPRVIVCYLRFFMPVVDFLALVC